MSEKFVTASHTRFPVKASVTSFLCLEYEKKLTLCRCCANCNADEGQDIIDKSNCLSVIARDFKIIRPVTRENQRRTRDREPSRIPGRTTPNSTFAAEVIHTSLKLYYDQFSTP